jgi:hypothetical protein
MVAKHKSLLAVQSVHDLLGPIDLTKEDITQNIDDVVMSNTLVPVCDQRTVHLINRRVWTVAVLDDVGVPEMQVTGKVCVHG